jgi:uncharacterized protein
MSLSKPSDAEDEYFAREEAARHQRDALERAHQMEEKQREELKKLHYMKCPKCGFDLREMTFRGVVIDKCYHCHGTWFDEHELEQLTGHKKYDILESIMRVFRRARP